MVERTLTGALRYNMQAGYLASNGEDLGFDDYEGPLGRVFLCREGRTERDVHRTEKTMRSGAIDDQHACDCAGKYSTGIVLLQESRAEVSKMGDDSKVPAYPFLD
jgi:hypothetical protein